MLRFAHTAGDTDDIVELGWFDDPESCLANNIGRMAGYHNTKRLATAHSLGMMPDYMRGLICFNKITGLIKVKGLTACKKDTRERIKDTEPEWDVCTAMSKPIQLLANLDKVDTAGILFAGGPGRISYLINCKRFQSQVWKERDIFTPLVYFDCQTGFILFGGLDFTLPTHWHSIWHRRHDIAKLDERERELWVDFREWRAKYKNSKFINDVWEPLDNISHALRGLEEAAIVEVVSTAIKRHYKLIALFRCVSYGIEAVNVGDPDRMLFSRCYALERNPFVEIKARLREVTGFDGFHCPSDIGILNLLLPHWKEYLPEIRERMAKVVGDFCPEAPKVAQFLLEKHQGISVTLEAKYFCPFQYFDSATEDPLLSARVGEEGWTDCSDSDSEDQMSEDDSESLGEDNSDSEDQMSEDDSESLGEDSSDLEDQMSEDD